MESLSGAIGEVADAPEQEKRPALKALKQIFEGVLTSPEAPSEWSATSLQGRQLAARPHVTKCLRAAGFEEQPSGGGTWRLAPGKAPEDLQDGAELCAILLDSMGEDSAAGAGCSTMDDEDELAAAMRLSMGQEGSEPKRQRQEDDAAMAARLAQEDDEQPQVAVEFERFRDEDVLVDDAAVKEINAFCEESGEPYVDPQFPPVSRSLYINESDGTTWECFVCRHRSPLPPVPPIPETKEQAQEIEESFNKVVCASCGEKAPFVVKTRYFNRPMGWLRPGVKCEHCTASAPYEYPNVRDATSLIELMCTHYLRSAATKKTLGQPWKVIRDQPRPEDVQQGALGNCWFAAALSIVASKPALIWNLFITRDFNKHGAYQLQLHHGGDWRGILIDDLFPTSQVRPGRIVGDMIYYSLGGNLSYMSCARHQLWVPMIEKAAAKLAGSYGNLSSGTFGEALAMFTGFPTERLVLYTPKETRQAMAQARDRKIEERTQMLLRGETPPEDDEDDFTLDENYRNDMLWSKLLSFKEAGYLMGMGCTEQGCEKTKEHILEKGLQAPHAYGILDVREVTGPDGNLLRMMQIRNPWGENAPRTWTGDWGKTSPKWTFDMKLKLGVVNRSNVEMYDQMSIFWMTFEDVKEYFAVVDVCRVHEGWEEYRQKAWLPCGVGPGEAFDLTVFERTQVDIALWQEKHFKRESAMGGNTNVDVGFVVLRRKGTNPDGTVEWQCVEYVKRTGEDCTSQELILEGGFVYRIAPLCFNQMQQMAPRRVACAVHASKPCTLSKISSSWRDLAAATFAAATKGRSANIQPGVKTYFLQDRVGYILAVENDREQDFGIQVDSQDSVGFISSREGGMCGCIDLVPGRSRKVVMVLACQQGASRMSLSFAMDGLPPEAAAWAVQTEDLHIVMPLTPLAKSTSDPAPDAQLLAATLPEREARELHARGHQPPILYKAPAAEGAAEEDDDAAALAEAMKLSMGQDEGAPMETDDGDDEDLAAAIALSMGNQEPASAPAAAPAVSSTAPASNAASSGQSSLQQQVQELVAEYTKQGMSSNEAALKALEVVKARASGSAGGAAASTPAPAPAPAPAPTSSETPATASTPAPAISKDAFRALFQTLVAQYTAEGMNQTDAAAKALTEARARLAGGK